MKEKELVTFPNLKPNQAYSIYIVKRTNEQGELKLEIYTEGSILTTVIIFDPDQSILTKSTPEKTITFKGKPIMDYENIILDRNN